jgi:hypothetical protein
MSPEERMRRLIAQRMRDPYGITMESQVDKQTEQLSPGAMAQAGGTPTPTAPALPSEREIAMQAASRSTAGAEGRLKNQQAFANSLRGTPSAKMQRVGPSGITVANPWDGLEVGFNRALGGYLSGQLRGEYDELDETKSAQAQNAARYNEILTEEERGFEAGESEQDRALRQAIAAEQNAVTARGQDMTAASAAARVADSQTQRAQDGTPVMLEPIGGGEPVPVIENQGRYFQYDPTAPDGRGPMFDARGYLPLDTTATGSGAAMDRLAAQAAADREAAAQGARGEALKASGAASTIAGILEDPMLDAAMGWGGQSLLGEVGVGPEGAAVQDLQRRIRSDQLGGLIPALAEAKLTPVSDTDFKKLAAKYVSVRDQPYALVGFHATEGRALWNRKFDEAIEAGSLTEADREAALRNLDATLIRSAAMHNYPDSKLIQNGVDPEYIEYIRLLDKQRGR